MGAQVWTNDPGMIMVHVHRTVLCFKLQMSTNVESYAMSARALQYHGTGHFSRYMGN